jgi:thymidine kinase
MQMLCHFRYKRKINENMFIEPKRGKAKDTKSGWIEVITGSMFSGKTEELIRRLKRAQIAKLNVEIFKPKIDVRYDENDIVSHNQNAIRNEAQFLDHSIVEVCNKLSFQGKRVIVAGLDMDSKGLPFGSMPQLLAVAEYVTKVHAICVKCGDIAHFSYRKSNAENLILLGEHDIYEARCRTCFQEN